MKITDKDIEKARETNLANLMDSLDIPYQSSSDHVKINCPYHQEQTPSCALYDDGHFFCYSCSEHGDAIKFTMDILKVDFVKAIEILNKL